MSAKRRRLVDLLGDRCADCGLRLDQEAFEFFHIDHLDGRNWDPAKLGSDARVNRYWREFHAGVRLRLLCADCNGWHGRYGLQRSKERKAREQAAAA